MELGYNVKKINELISSIGSNCKEIKNSMQSGWPEVQNVLQTEWIGSDEQSFEQKLAARVIELWQSIQSNCNIFMQNLQSTGESWVKFQASNVLEGATAAEGAAAVKYEPIEAGDPDVVLKQVTFTEEMDLGLQSGVGSAEKIATAIKDYITTVYNNTKNLFDEMDASTSFIGADQAAAVKKYIGEMGQSFALVTTCYKDLGNAMKELIAAYEQQSQAVQTAVGEKAPTIDTAGNQWEGFGE